MRRKGRASKVEVLGTREKIAILGNDDVAKELKERKTGDRSGLRVGGGGKESRRSECNE